MLQGSSCTGDFTIKPRVSQGNHLLTQQTIDQHDSLASHLNRGLHPRLIKGACANRQIPQLYCLQLLDAKVGMAKVAELVLEPRVGTALDSAMLSAM